MSEHPLDRAAYRITEAAHYLAISRSRLTEIIAAGFLKPVSLGDRKLILRADLDRLLAGLSTGEIVIPKRQRHPHETEQYRQALRDRQRAHRQAKKATRPQADA